MSTNEQTLKELYETKQKAEAAIAALEAQRTPSPGLPSLGAVPSLVRQTYNDNEAGGWVCP